MKVIKITKSGKVFLDNYSAEISDKATKPKKILCPTVTKPAAGVIATSPTTAPTAAPTAERFLPEALFPAP